MHNIQQLPDKEPVTAAVLAPEEVNRQTQRLQTAFEKIYVERMHDVPIINDRIKVTAIGFQRWQDSFLCIMITPWFMNIMLLPGKDEDWDELQETSAISHTFPSGRYEFLVGYEADIGKYQMCSLFSPMFEFADDNAAVETAQAAINELMNMENIETSDIDSSQIEGIWNGTVEHPDKAKNSPVPGNPEHGTKPLESTQTISLQEKMQKPVSRRQLLRGAVMLDDDEHKNVPGSNKQSDHKQTRHSPE